MIDQSTTPPAIERWQSGYRIPLNIEHHPGNDEEGEHWTFDVLFVHALTGVDVARAVVKQYQSSPTVAGERLAEALDIITDAVTPAVTDLRDLTQVVAAKLVAAANESPQPWVQPTGGHDAYLPGAIVLDGVGGDRHRNTLPVPNVWGLDEHGWENLDAVVPTGPRPWVQPTGASDAYSIGEEVTHAAPAFPEFNLWRSNIDANTTEPGTDGVFHRWWEPIS